MAMDMSKLRATLNKRKNIVDAKSSIAGIATGERAIGTATFCVCLHASSGSC
jgi:hypothetical protein